MNLSDLRRLSISVLIVAVVSLLFVMSIAIHDNGWLEWRLPEAALELFPYGAWLWLGIAAMFILVFIVGLVPFGVAQAPEGFTRGAARQVQCQNCKAVFFIHDTGHRPLTHMCPNCKHLGVYDGNAPPVGRPPKPEPPRRIIRMDLECRHCKDRFAVTDTGARPLHVRCDHCGTKGKVL